MSFNRRRNIFTLGDFHLQHQHQHPVKAQLSKRQNSDPFERDPFKIQSYNFHYADRPTYQVASIVSRSSKTNTVATKPFETHFYNHGFTSGRHDKENSTTNKFHEFRRRKFLLNHQQVAPTQQRDTQHQQQHHAQELQQECQQQRQQQQQQHNQQSTSTSAAEAAAAAAKIRSFRSPLFRTEPRAATSPTTTLLRNGANRECLPRLRTLHSSSPSSSSNIQARQQQGSLQRSSSFVRSSSSRVSLVESNVGVAGVRRLQKANTFISSSNNSSSNKNNTSKGLSFSSKGQNNRNPLQTIHVSSQNLVAKSSNSGAPGCQINIRIKGLDDKALSENVTIKIESDLSPRKQINKQTQPLLLPKQPQGPVSPNYLATKFDDSEDLKNIDGANSSETIVINKRLSKYSISERSLTQIKPHCIELNPLKSIKNEKKDRIPGIVPWVLNKNNMRSSFGSSENNTESPLKTAHSSLLRRISNNYNAGLDDLKNLREKSKRTKTTTPIGVQKPFTPKLPAEHKLLNTITVNRKVESLTPAQKPNVKSHGSHISLRNNIDRRNATSPDNTLTTSLSSTSQMQRINAPLVYQTTRRSISPLNVNINVYADKLKLLRV